MAKKVDVNKLVAGEEDLEICPDCGCAIIMDMETGEPLCNCSVEEEKPQPKSKKKTKAKKEDKHPEDCECEDCVGKLEEGDKQGPSIQELLQQLPDAPSQAEIDAAKQAYGKIYVMPFDEDEMYIWRPIKYREWQQIQMNQHLDSEQKMQEYVVTRAVIWPKLSPEMIGVSRAGTVPTLFQVISVGSNFIPADMAINLVREL